jgi:phosphate transport system protein
MLSPRETYDRHLKQLVDQVLLLGSMVEQAIQQSVAALLHRDHAAARQISASDQSINEKRYTIENDCVTLIATQQPMARDVRFLAAILEIITELERIGDYAKGICKINLLLGDEPVEMSILYDLERMANQGLRMLHHALTAFVDNDVATARALPAEDDAVDRLYNHIYRELTRQNPAKPSAVDSANHLIWAAHNLERLADRVTNICERIVYVATGEMKELDTPSEVKIEFEL